MPRRGSFIRARSAASRSAAQVIEIEPLHDRDMIEHRRIMATINDLAKALHTTPERVRAELLVATGNFTLLGDLLGREVVAVNSMSRRNMKDHELHEFWDEAQGGDPHETARTNCRYRRAGSPGGNAIAAARVIRTRQLPVIRSARRPDIAPQPCEGRRAEGVEQQPERGDQR